MKTGIHIDGGKSSADKSRTISVLEKVALRATELGREDTAREAIRALGEIASIKNVTITGSMIGDNR